MVEDRILTFGNGKKRFRMDTLGNYFLLMRKKNLFTWRK